MYQDYELTVNPGVEPEEPTEFIKTFPPCDIERITITFPKGPNREVYVRFRHEAEFIYPRDPGEWVNGEGEAIVITGPWANWDGLYKLRIQMCSPGARLPHKITFRFDLAEEGSLTQGISRLTAAIYQPVTLPWETGG